LTELMLFIENGCKVTLLLNLCSFYNEQELLRVRVFEVMTFV